MTLMANSSTGAIATIIFILEIEGACAKFGNHPNHVHEARMRSGAKNPGLCWLPPFLARPMKSWAFTTGTMNGCLEDCFNVKYTGVRSYKGSTYMLHRRYFTGQSKKEFIGNKANTNDI